MILTNDGVKYFSAIFIQIRNVFKDEFLIFSTKRFVMEIFGIVVKRSEKWKCHGGRRHGGRDVSFVCVMRSVFVLKSFLPN